MTFEEIYAIAKDITGYPNEGELNLLYLLASFLEPGSTVVEIGCDFGKSTVVLGAVAKKNNLKFYTVDNFVYNDGLNEPQFYDNIAKAGLTDVVTLLRKDSVKAAKDFDDESVDFIFFDGDHHVEPDCIAWLPKLKPNGYALFHDYGDESYPNLKRDVDKHTGDWLEVGQVRVLKARKKP